MPPQVLLCHALSRDEAWSAEPLLQLERAAGADITCAILSPAKRLVLVGLSSGRVCAVRVRLEQE